MSTDQPSAPLVKSRQRVADHGEVFTPGWMVEAMLAQVQEELDRIGARFLEPACGSGNFLAPVLEHKLNAVQARYGKSEFDRRHQALFALMSVYGIELLEDNIEECRERLLAIYLTFLAVEADSAWARAGAVVLGANIIRGNAMSMQTPGGELIEFPEWAYVGRGKYQRRDFGLDNLSQRSRVSGTLFDHFEEHDVFQPTRTYSPMTVEELAA